MPHYNVEYQEKWAIFSTIVEEFITTFKPREIHQRHREEKYGKDCGPLEKANREEIGDAVFSLCLNHTKQEALQNLLDSGIEKEDAETLIEKFGEYQSREADDDE